MNDEFKASKVCPQTLMNRDLDYSRIPLCLNWMEANNWDHLFPLLEQFPILKTLIRENQGLCDRVNEKEYLFSKFINFGRKLASILKDSKKNHQTKLKDVSFVGKDIEKFCSKRIDCLNESRKRLKNQYPFYCVVDAENFKDDLEKQFSSLMNYNRELLEKINDSITKMEQFYYSILLNFVSTELLNSSIVKAIESFCEKTPYQLKKPFEVESPLCFRGMCISILADSKLIL